MEKVIDTIRTFPGMTLMVLWLGAVFTFYFI